MWKLRLSNLLFRFFRNRLGHLNNRQTKIAENSKIHFFESYHQSKCLVKVWSSLTHSPQTYGPLTFFAKFKGNNFVIASFSKFRKGQTFVLTDLHNLSKGQLADRKFKLWKSCVYYYRAVKHITFEILTFQFSKLPKKQILLRILWKNFQFS